MVQNRVLAVVNKIERYGEDVFHVEFGVAPKYNRFLPGQFLHLALDPFDPKDGYWPDSRVFSICTEPLGDHVSIVYSVKGAFTKRMAAELSEGKEVWLKYPYGDFVVDRQVIGESPIVLVAGGTGVSPYLPFLLSEVRKDSLRIIDLHYGIRDPNHFLFQEELSSVADRLRNFTLHLSIQHGRTDRFPFEMGALDINDLVPFSGPDPGDSIFFLSGPPAMIEAFQAELVRRKVDPQRIKVDEWG